jgi:transposase, IS5 family
MLSQPVNSGQMGFYSTFEEQLSRKHPLYILANRINWQQFDEAFKELYCLDNGRPAKPIRLMVSLLILKHIRNLSDESVVEQWAENAYYQYFSGERCFAARVPCEATELVHFRKRIGEKGMELILKESIRINGKDADENQGTIDTTVQEKNITFPTDNKLHRKIIRKCVAIAEKEDIVLRQRYSRTLKKLLLDQRFRYHPKNYGKARKADRKVKTIAGRLVRELERKLPAGLYATELALFNKVLSQQRHDHDKIYSLHEPHVQCISKGKEHKKYEFGSKVSIIATKNSGVIIGAINIEKNDYDAHTLDPALEQQQRLTGHVLKEAFVDRGYRGIKQVRGTVIHTPKPFDQKLSLYKQQKMKKGFRRRAAIEPRISHLKTDYRLSRNFYRGIFGDNINIMLAAAAMNFKRMMNIWKQIFLALLLKTYKSIIQRLESFFYFPKLAMSPF